MQNFQQILTEAAQLKQHQLKKDRKGYQSLPQFLKSGLGYNKKYENIRRQNFIYQFRISNKVKQQGNLLFKQNKIQQALTKYEEALSLFRYIQSTTYENMKDQHLTYHLFEPKDLGENLKSKYEALLCALYLNICSCLTKLNKKQDAIFSAEEALKIKKTAKGHYKKAQAYLKYVNKDANDVKLGLLELKQAYSLDKDPQIIKEMHIAKQNYEKEQQKSKNWFKFMFDKTKQTNKEQGNMLPPQNLPKDLQKQQKSKVKKSNQRQIQQLESQVAKGICQDQKLLQTQQKLKVYANMAESEWEYMYQKDFIKRHGSKIYSILKIYKHEDLAAEFRGKLANCLESEEKEIKNKMKCSECIEWLKSHPVNKIMKYSQRYTLQTNWIKENRKKKSEQKQNYRQGEQNSEKYQKTIDVSLQGQEKNKSGDKSDGVRSEGYKRDKLNNYRKQLQAQFSEQVKSNTSQQRNNSRENKIKLVTVSILLFLLLLRFLWH